MAEGKKSFVLYTKLIEVVEELTDEEAGMLFKTILRYVNDKDPEVPKEIKLAFIPIKQELKSDLKKYEEKCKKNQENIRKRWNTMDNKPIQPNTNEYERIISYSDNDNEYDNDNDTSNEVIKESNNNIITKESVTKRSVVLDHWNSLNIIHHKEISKKAEEKLKNILKEHSLEEVLIAMDRYNQVLKDNTYFFSYKWTLEEFLCRKGGIADFYDEGSKWVNYLNSESGNKAQEKYLANNIDFHYKNLTQEDEDFFEEYARSQRG